jgi:hypothetical protein
MDTHYIFGAGTSVTPPLRGWRIEFGVRDIRPAFHPYHDSLENSFGITQVADLRLWTACAFERAEASE